MGLYLLFWSGRLQKDSEEMAIDEYWMKSGARPKFTSLMHGGLFLARSRDKGMAQTSLLS